jgi:hypothetical protein
MQLIKLFHFPIGSKIAAASVFETGENSSSLVL